MNVPEALSYLESLSRHGIRPGLERMVFLLDRLGHPEKVLRVVHVAGTNGKGSTAAILASVLTAAGYRVGLYTSPHLHSPNERLSIGGRLLPLFRFARYVGRVARAAAGCVRLGLEQPTEFEVVTAAMYLAFAGQGVDVLVQETGLGGRLDATNVVPPPLVSIIAPIGLDHTDHLGRTLAEVAREKAGIIKPGSAVVSAPQPAAAAAEIESAARRHGCTLIRVGRDVAVRAGPLTLEGGEFDYRGLAVAYEGLHVALSGRHQLTNAACALATIELLNRGGFRVGEEAVRAGLRSVRWPGRLEVLCRDPLILADGAHNPAGAQALRAAIRELLPGHRLILVMGVMRDKDARGMLAELAPLASLVVATSPGTPRALEPLALSLLAGEHGVKTVVEPDPRAALDLARAQAGPGGAVCVTGSLYLVGQVRSYPCPHPRRAGIPLCGHCPPGGRTARRG